MKYLVMCEGPNEKAVMDILLEHHLLKFSEDDLLGLVTYHARQIATSAQVRTALNLYPGEIRILRIGDKQSDALQIPPGYQSKIVSVEKYCTKPELEMLLILSEELEQAYVKPAFLRLCQWIRLLFYMDDDPDKTFIDFQSNHGYNKTKKLIFYFIATEGWKCSTIT